MRLRGSENGGGGGLLVTLVLNLQGCRGRAIKRLFVSTSLVDFEVIIPLTRGGYPPQIVRDSMRTAPTNEHLRSARFVFTGAVIAPDPSGLAGIHSFEPQVIVVWRAVRLLADAYTHLARAEVALTTAAFPSRVPSMNMPFSNAKSSPTPDAILKPLVSFRSGAFWAVIARRCKFCQACGARGRKFGKACGASLAGLVWSTWEAVFLKSFRCRGAGR